MKMIHFLRLCRKHIVLLVSIPLLMAAIVILLTRKPDFSYTSQTVLYTGLATGSTIEMDKTFNYFLTNTAFDNLINIINSRETQEAVAIRLLCQHLMLDGPDPKFISAKSYAELTRITPAHIHDLVRKPSGQCVPDSVLLDRAPVVDAGLFPSRIDRNEYEAAVERLTRYMKSSDSNFVYKLLSFDDPHYSIKAISSVKVARVGTSDLMKLSYEIDDPGICQQTLAIFNDVCIKNYKKIRENRSDDVVRYFQSQLHAAERNLGAAEGKLLDFNQTNKIINYDEQSKAVAVVRENLEVSYNAMKAELAGKEAAIRRLEEKLNIQQLVQLKSDALLEKKKELGDANYELALAEVDTTGAGASRLDGLRERVGRLEKDIRGNVQDLYTYQNTTDGLPVNTVLTDWINNVLDAENMKAKLSVMDERNADFQQKYAVYAPAGANIKRMEREISVSEQGYLDLLHGLNMAKLKMQDNELSSELKTIDPPFFPLEPNQTKRKMLVLLAAVVSGILVLAIILLLEYSDGSLRNLSKAGRILGIKGVGMLPKIYLKPEITDFPSIQERMVGMTAQNLAQAIGDIPEIGGPRKIAVLSVTGKEGKTVVAGNLARYFSQQGKKVVFVGQARETSEAFARQQLPIIRKVLGYPDPRVDKASPFLASPATYLDQKEWREKWDRNMTVDADTDFVFIEVPALLSNNNPVDVINAADACLMVCRSNRVWQDADHAALARVTSLKPERTFFILNGITLEEAESMVGELPKQRSSMRVWVKKVLRMQFKRSEQF